MKNVLLGLVFLICAALPAAAQGCGPGNPNCIVPTAPNGTSDNRAASTAFVQNQIGGGGFLDTICSTNNDFLIRVTGAWQCGVVGTGLTSSGGTIAVTTGTSGHLIPFLDGTNVWSGANTFSTPIAVASGGTGLATLTANAVMLGEGTSNPDFATTGTAGRILIDQGSGADPAFKAASGSCTVTSAGVFSCTGAASSITIGTTDVIGASAGQILYSDGTLLQATPGVTSVGTGQVALAAGTVTSSTKSINITQTWNNGGTTFDAPIFANVTNTASATVSFLEDLQIGGVTHFAVMPQGASAGVGVGPYTASSGSDAFFGSMNSGASYSAINRTGFYVNASDEMEFVSANSIVGDYGITSASQWTLAKSITFNSGARFGGGTPTIASGACGATSNGTIGAGSTNQSGLLQIGSATTTTCTVSFSATLVAAPGACVLFPANAAAAATGTTVAYVSSITTTNWVLTGSALANANYYYHCI